MKVTELLETVQLTKKEFTPAVKAFLDEFDKHTVPHPFDRRQSIYNDSVGIGVHPERGIDQVELQSIMTFTDKNQGDGSKALKWVCDLADKHHVDLTLDVSPIKNAGSRTGKNLNKKELTAWYAKNGFKKQGGDSMIRKAKGSGDAT